MKVTAIVTQANGIISVVLQPTFVGDMTDASDKQKIAAFGDPEVNISGTFTDPTDNTFTFQFPTTEKYVGITTELSQQSARFMLALPAASNPNQPASTQGPMDCITPDPSRAAQVWSNVMAGTTYAGGNTPSQSRIGQSMSSLRSQTIVPSISPVTI